MGAHKKAFRVAFHAELLFLGGRGIRSDTAVVLCSLRGAETSADLEFGFDGASIALGLVVGKGNSFVTNKAEDVVFVGSEACQSRQGVSPRKKRAIQ